MKQIYSCLFLIIAFAASAQEESKESPHQLSISAVGVLSKQLDEPAIGKANTENGYQVGVGYRYYLNPKWSLGSGLEYQYYKTNMNLASLSDRYNTVDLEGDSFEYRYTATAFSENQKMHYLAIPLNIQFETAGPASWYANVGMKVGFNLSANYETSIDKLTTSGYYPQWNVELYDPTFIGFGTWSDFNSRKQDLDVKTQFMLTAESGIKLQMTAKSNLYVGLYMNYGLNDLKQSNSNQNPIVYNTNNPKEPMLNSLLNASDSKGAPYLSKYNLFSFGIKLNWSFRI